MVRYMADSTVCSQIPSQVSVPGRGVQPVSLRCGYLGGSYQKSSHACGPVDVEIDVDGNHPQADVLDVEPGDATPDTVPSWIRRHNALGGFPAIIYCNRSTIHAVANYCAAAGLQVGRDYFWWIATLNGVTSVADMTGVVAVQAWGANYFPGHNIDLSVVYNDSWKSISGGDMPLTDADVTKIMDWPFATMPDGSIYNFGNFLKLVYADVTDLQAKVADLQAKVGTGGVTQDMLETALRNVLKGL